MTTKPWFKPNDDFCLPDLISVCRFLFVCQTFSLLTHFSVYLTVPLAVSFCLTVLVSVFLSVSLYFFLFFWMSFLLSNSFSGYWASALIQPFDKILMKIILDFFIFTTICVNVINLKIENFLQFFFLANKMTSVFYFVFIFLFMDHIIVTDIATDNGEMISVC